MLHDEDYFISCDWGTSAFRLKLVDRNTSTVAATVENTQGIKKVYDAFLKQTAIEQEAYFMAFLEQQIQDLEQQIAWSNKRCCIVVSGMASSSIGLKELSYADLPFDVQGKNLVFKHLYHPAVCTREVLLISGVKKRGDVMRGEEMQLIGLFQHPDLKYRQGNFVFPGTHTKQIQVKDSQLIDFQTHMTGELYDVIKSHTILKNSLDTPSDWNENTKSAFRAGVLDSQRQALTHTLFSIRAKNLQGYLSKAEAGHYLSGLLIGSELKALNQDTTTFCCNSTFYPLYQEAIQALDHLEQYDFLSPSAVNDLIVKGHKTFLDAFI